jgi:hypothetical protein
LPVELSRDEDSPDSPAQSLGEQRQVRTSRARRRLRDQAGELAQQAEANLHADTQVIDDSSACIDADTGVATKKEKELRGEPALKPEPEPELEPELEPQQEPEPEPELELEPMHEVEVEKEQEPEAEPEPEPEQRLESQLARQTDQVMKRKRWMPRWLFLPAGVLVVVVARIAIVLMRRR